MLERLNSVDDEDTAKINERRKIGSEKWRDKILDEIFNNNNGTSFAQIYKNSNNRNPSAITWGRIGCNFEAVGSESNEQLSRPLAFDSDKVNRLINFLCQIYNKINLVYLFCTQILVDETKDKVKIMLSSKETLHQQLLPLKVQEEHKQKLIIMMMEMGM